MFRLITSIVMIVVYWGAFIVAKSVRIISPKEPDYLYFAEGPLIILVFAALILIIAALTRLIRKVLPFPIISFFLGVIGMGVVMLPFYYLFGPFINKLDFEHNSIYLDHRFAWNVGFVIAWHMIAVLFAIFGVRSLVKRERFQGDKETRIKLYRRYGIEA